MNSVTVIGALSTPTFPLYAGIFAAATSTLLVLSHLRYVRQRTRHKKSAQETAALLSTLEKNNEVRNNFLNALSHEIRNPLNGITGLAESMNASTLEPKSRQKLDLLRQCSSHLASLLDEVLDFSKIQPEAFKFNPKIFELAELMHSVAALVAAESEKRGIPVEIALSPALPRQVVGDPLRIRQIVLNYVYNALKYSSRGKISITIWQNKISPDSTEIFFAVSDQGPGISVEEQTKLFAPAESISDSASVRPARKTLGLSICKTLAEKAGGAVWVESEPGKGSVFYFKAIFPLVDNTGKASGITPTCPTNNYKNALVIDDEEYNRVALTGLLETLNLQVFAAAHDRQALDLAAEHPFDLIFVDYSIPGLNGAAIAREIRRMPGPSRKAAIFATTAFNTPEIRSTCLAAGMDAFLTKPITPEQLRLALGALAIKGESANSPRAASSTPLANLRLLATRKGISFHDELKLYFAEFETEFNQLQAALKNVDPGRAAYYAHLLYGRCSFIGERSLETKLRKIEFAAATGRWDEAHDEIPAVKDELVQLRLRLSSDDPIAQRE